MRKTLLAIALWLWAAPAFALVCPSVPNTFSNGTVADANQVNANFQALLNCLNTNVAMSGANTNITALNGVTLTGSTTVSGPLNVGTGSPLTFAHNTPLQGAASFIPSATDTTGVPTLMVERVTNYSGGAFTSPTLFVGTQTVINATTAWQDGIDSELEITGAGTGSGAGFAEAVRAACNIGSGVSHTAKCTGLAAVGTQIDNNTLKEEVLGVEAEVDANFSTRPHPRRSTRTT